MEWRKTDVHLNGLSTRLRNSLCGKLTVFSVNDHADETAQVVGREQAPDPAAATEDEDEYLSDAEYSDAEYFSEVETIAKERILDLLYEFDGHEFEGVVGDVLRAMAFTVRGHGRGPDGGVDLVATPDPLGFEMPRIKVQAKRQRGTAGRPVVQQLAGTLRDGEKGLFVSLGGFTTDAQNESSQSMTLMDGDAFVDLLLDHYEKLSPETRTRVPLKRLYVPVG